MIDVNAVAVGAVAAGGNNLAFGRRNDFRSGRTGQVQPRVERQMASDGINAVTERAFLFSALEGRGKRQVFYNLAQYGETIQVIVELVFVIRNIARSVGNIRTTFGLIALAFAGLILAHVLFEFFRLQTGLLD